jgi:hypothetical protein
MEAVLLIAHETLAHGSGEKRAFFKKKLRSGSTAAIVFDTIKTNVFQFF